MQTWAGSRENPVQLETVERWLVEAGMSYSGATIRCDPWQSVGSMQRLRSRGVRVEEFTFSASSVADSRAVAPAAAQPHAVAT